MSSSSFVDFPDIQFTEGDLGLGKVSGTPARTNVCSGTKSRSSSDRRAALQNAYVEALRNNFEPSIAHSASACIAPEPHPLPVSMPVSLPTPIPLSELLVGHNLQSYQADDMMPETQQQYSEDMFGDIDEILDTPSTTPEWGIALPPEPLLEVTPGQWSSVKLKTTPKAPKQYGSPSADGGVHGPWQHPSNTAKIDEHKGTKRRHTPGTATPSDFGRKRTKHHRPDPVRITLMDEAIQEVLSAGRRARMPSFSPVALESQPEVQRIVQPSNGTMDLVDQAIQEARLRIRKREESSQARRTQWIQVPQGCTPMHPMFAMRNMDPMFAMRNMGCMGMAYPQFSRMPHPQFSRVPQMFVTFSRYPPC